MDESLKKYMKVGLIHFMAFPETIKGEGPIAETVRKIAVDDYFDAIEITWIKDPGVRAQVKTMLQAAHMTVAYGGQPRLLTTGLNINDLDESGRSRAVDTLKEGIDEAYEMGAAGFAFLSGKYDENRREEAYRALVQSTSELCSYAGDKGDMKIVHEIFDHDVDKASLVGPVQLAARYAEEITGRFANFGLMVDLSHLPLLRESAREAILPVKDYLAHVHMGNAVVKPGSEAYGDMHPRFGFPDSANDTPELAEFLRVLLEIGFLNPENPPVVSFEVKPWGDEDPEIVIANAKRTLNRAWLSV